MGLPESCNAWRSSSMSNSSCFSSRRGVWGTSGLALRVLRFLGEMTNSSSESLSSAAIAGWGATPRLSFRRDAGTTSSASLSESAAGFCGVAEGDSELDTSVLLRFNDPLCGFLRVLRTISISLSLSLTGSALGSGVRWGGDLAIEIPLSQYRLSRSGYDTISPSF